MLPSVLNSTHVNKRKAENESVSPTSKKPALSIPLHPLTCPIVPPIMQKITLGESHFTLPCNPLLASLKEQHEQGRGAQLLQLTKEIMVVRNRREEIEREIQKLESDLKKTDEEEGRLKEEARRTYWLPTLDLTTLFSEEDQEPVTQFLLSLAKDVTPFPTSLEEANQFLYYSSCLTLKNDTIEFYKSTFVDHFQRVAGPLEEHEKILYLNKKFIKVNFDKLCKNSEFFTAYPKFQETRISLLPEVLKPHASLVLEMIEKFEKGETTFYAKADLKLCSLLCKIAFEIDYKPIISPILNNKCEQLLRDTTFQSLFGEMDVDDYLSHAQFNQLKEYFLTIQDLMAVANSYPECKDSFIATFMIMCRDLQFDLESENSCIAELDLIEILSLPELSPLRKVLRPLASLRIVRTDFYTKIGYQKVDGAELDRALGMIHYLCPNLEHIEFCNSEDDVGSFVITEESSCYYQMVIEKLKCFSKLKTLKMEVRFSENDAQKVFGTYAIAVQHQPPHWFLTLSPEKI